MSNQENQIVCLNYCMQDQETGFCLTCGRPPIPVTGVDLNARSFAGINLSGISLSSGQEKISDESQQ